MSYLFTWDCFESKCFISSHLHNNISWCEFISSNVCVRKFFCADIRSSQSCDILESIESVTGVATDELTELSVGGVDKIVTFEKLHEEKKIQLKSNSESFNLKEKKASNMNKESKNKNKYSSNDPEELFNLEIMKYIQLLTIPSFRAQTYLVVIHINPCIVYNK